MRARFNQMGSVASFIVIGVALVLVTTGILYWVQHKDAPVAREESPVVTVPDEEPAPVKEEETDQEEVAPTPATTPEPTPSTPTPETAPTVSTLSQTGPADTALQLLALGALAVTVAGFARSRKLRSSL